MTISYDRGNIYFECDANRCPEILETKTDDFGTAVEIAQENHWKIRKVNEVWQHFCPDEDSDGLGI